MKQTTPNSFIVCILLILSIPLISCERFTPKYFDFAEFEEKGLAKPGNKKFLSYLIVNRHDVSGIDMECMMGRPQALYPYIDNPNVDVLFLIEVPEKDKEFIEAYLQKWCFKDYLITHKTPDFFKLAKRNKIKGISYMFNKNGKVIALTNHTMPNFKKLMEN